MLAACYKALIRKGPFKPSINCLVFFVIILQSDSGRSHGSTDVNALRMHWGWTVIWSFEPLKVVKVWTQCKYLSKIKAGWSCIRKKDNILHLVFTGMKEEEEKDSMDDSWGQNHEETRCLFSLFSTLCHASSGHLPMLPPWNLNFWCRITNLP